ncbi:two-component regulator propeller domain-containing protein, partial [Runella sp.]|uniref:ligand-binding sensor domain-containing protein n=1 Tax=Runella sp. TaxID=1960881 RepID=UPI00301779E4
MYQDKHGVLWIGSKLGLYQYDGANAIPFSLSKQDTDERSAVHAIKEDPEGNLWIGTEKGFRILDPLRSKLLPLSDFNLPDSFATIPLSFTNGPQNSFYIRTSRQIFQYRDRKLTLKWTVPLNSNLNAFIILYSKAEDRIYTYIGNDPSARLTMIEADGTIIYDPYIYDKFGWVFVGFLCYQVEGDSVRWFYRNERINFDKQHKAFFIEKNNYFQVHFPEQKSLMDQFVQNQLQIKDPDFFTFRLTKVFILPNNVSVFVSTEGIFIFQPKKIKFNQIKASIGERIRAIQVDRFGHLIYGTYNGLLWQFPHEPKPHKLKKAWLAWSIQPLDTARTLFFLGGDLVNKKWRYLRSTPRSVSMQSQTADPYYTGLNIGGSSICTSYDIYRQGLWYLGDNYKIIFYDPKKNHYRFLKELNLNTFWGEHRGIVAGKDLWLGGPSGIKRFLNADPRSGYLQEDNTAIPNTIRTLSVFCMYGSSDNIIWIGADNGLFLYNPYTETFQQFTTKEGLPDNSVFSIIGEQGDSVLWIGTGNGLSRFDTKKRRFENFYREDGLTSNEFNTGSTYRAPDGTIYMGGQNGINYFDPRTFRQEEIPLQQIAKVNLFGENATSKSQQILLWDGALLRIQPEVSLVEITFQTDDYVHAAQQHFRYRIPGVIEQWQVLNYADKALFPILPSGKHVLEVQTQNYRGIWQATSLYTLEVLPPWYETWWFRTLVFLLTGITLYALYWFRIRQLKREFAMRQQISDDLHDELGSRIFLLRTLSHKITNPLASDTDKKSNLDRFEETSQEAFKSIRDFIWAFNPKEDEAQQLFDRMEDFAENYLTPVIDTVNIHRSDIPKDIKIGPRAKHHLMNIYQELLTNMVKHTQSEKIDI